MVCKFIALRNANFTVIYCHTVNIMPHSQRSISLLWLGLVLTVVLSLAFLQSVEPNDYWWYVRLGEGIIATRSIPQIDTFSYTQAGQVMVYHSWLSAVIFAGVYQIGGLFLTVLLKGGLLAIFYASLWQVCRLMGAGARVASLCIILAVLSSCNNWVIRPQLFSYPLFGLTLWLVYRWEIGRNAWLWLLPLIMLVWVNVHGAFILGFLLVGGAFVFGRGERRVLAWVLLGMVLASLITPRLWGSWEYVWSLITDPSSQQFSIEWRPPTTETWLGKLFFGWFLLFPLLLHYSPSPLTRLQWVWFLGLGWMALSGVRYVIWFVAILALLTAYLVHPLLGHYLDRPVEQVKPAVNVAITVFFLLLSGLFLPNIRAIWLGDDQPVLSQNTPIEATNWLADHRLSLPGPLWSDVSFASYHIFALRSYPVWIDTRFELYPPEQWEMYLDLATAVPNWTTILDQEGINLLMLDPNNQPRLIQALQQNPTYWGLCYQDEVALLFTRLVDGQIPTTCNVSDAFSPLSQYLHHKLVAP